MQKQFVFPRGWGWGRWVKKQQQVCMFKDIGLSQYSCHSFILGVSTVLIEKQQSCNPVTSEKEYLNI